MAGNEPAGPDILLLHEMVDRFCAEHQLKPAIISADDSTVLSYGELVHRSHVHATRLRRLGLAHGDRVALIARKSPEVIAAFLGASRAGVAYLPIDIQAAPSVWATILKDLGITHVLSNEPGTSGKLPGFQVHDLEPGSEAEMPPVRDSTLDGTRSLMMTPIFFQRPGRRGVLRVYCCRTEMRSRFLNGPHRMSH